MKINLGCGSSPTPGYVNIDNSPTVRLANSPIGFLLRGKREFRETIRRMNVRYGSATKIPVADSCADVLFTSHMLEHLDRPEARTFLTEAKRVLRPGGVLRVAVPDLSKLVDYYNRTGDADGFMEWMLTCEEKPKSLGAKVRYLFAGFRHHHWMYDQASLCSLLREAGFESPTSVPPGETTIADPGELNLRERENDSFYVEARAPAAPSQASPAR